MRGIHLGMAEGEGLARCPGENPVIRGVFGGADAALRRRNPFSGCDLRKALSHDATRKLDEACGNDDAIPS